MERMSPLDASFLCIENDMTPMHIGGVAIFDEPRQRTTNWSRGSRRNCRRSRGTGRRCASCPSTWDSPAG